MTILVTGAGGNIGGRVADLLVRRGHPVRVSSRDAASLTPPEGAESAELDIADLGVPTTALRGVSTAFLYPTVQGIGGFLEAAAAEEVEHVVLLSSPASHQPIEHNSRIGLVHRAAERALEESGLGHTALYPSWLATNAARDWGARIRSEGRLDLPFPDARATPVHPGDVAEVAVALLTGDRFRGRVQTVTGPESLRLRDLVSVIAAETGREIGIGTTTPEQALAERPAWMPEEVLATLLRVEEDSVGVPSPVDNSVERVTGRPARPFREWVREHRDRFLPAA